MKYTKVEWWLPKLLCLVAAFAFWVYVMNEQNPMVENSYTIPVEIRNLDRSLVATNVPSTVRVRIRMPRSDMISMRSDNIKAYVDLKGLTNGDYPNTPIYISVPNDETILSKTPAFFDLNIDTYALKTLPATVEFFGNPETHFKAVQKSVAPDTITIAGSSTRVAAAERAVVSVGIAGKKKDFEEYDTVNVLDRNGATVTGIEVMPGNVRVAVAMEEEMKNARIPLKASAKGSVAKGYHLGRVSIDTPVVSVHAPVSFIDAHSVIELEPVDVTGAIGKVLTSVKVPVPEGSTVSPDTVNVAVEVLRDED
ncbi:MAG: CdaR family protein [Dialister sp.]|nr:CdaR family protein [Dialister sp.]